MPNKIHISLLLFILITLHLSGFAAVGRSIELSETNIRKFDTYQMDSIRQLKKYHYVDQQQIPKTLWERFKWWLSQWLNRIFNDSKGSVAVKYVLIIGLVLWVVYRLIIADKSGMIGRNRQSNLHSGYNKPINVIVATFDDDLQKAIDAADYRLAVRFWFLKTLQNLHHGQVIQWKEQKTNTDYIYEIKDQNLRKEFTGLSRIFDFAWYGEQTIEDKSFKEIESWFVSFNQTLKGGQV